MIEACHGNYVLAEQQNLKHQLTSLLLQQPLPLAPFQDEGFNAKRFDEFCKSTFPQILHKEAP